MFTWATFSVGSARIHLPSAWGPANRVGLSCACGCRESRFAGLDKAVGLRPGYTIVLH